MKRRRKRACHHCGEGFLPKPHNKHKQCYCSAPECQKASARKSRAEWRKKNPDYDKGPEAVERVKRWRAQKPRYWRRKEGPLEPDALQENCIPEPVDDQADDATLEAFALQENYMSQVPVILGLIAHLSDTALLEDIDETWRELHKRGRQILDIRSAVSPNTQTTENHAKTSSRFKTATARAGPF